MFLKSLLLIVIYKNKQLKNKFSLSPFGCFSLFCLFFSIICDFFPAFFLFVFGLIHDVIATRSDYNHYTCVEDYLNHCNCEAAAPAAHSEEDASWTASVCHESKI